VISLDTNVFIYLLDDAAPAKQAIAAEVIAACSALGSSIALQVVGEAQNVARRKLQVPPFVAAQFARNILTAFDVIPASVEDAEIALAQMAAGRVSYWDALLLACVRRHGCSTLLSEDLQDGATVLGVRIINPFGEGGLTAPARDALGLT
jgi:predicted nucleic acid-binding protein